MESTYTASKPLHHGAATTSARPARRKANGSATAALLIQMATEILTASPTMRHRMNITLTDLSAADKIRKQLLKPATTL
ncbi:MULTISPECIES: hypothetical protein [Spirosoma]|uniref:Uncharacterized protein n=1 Tax=Spirosoma sordidisoli TaxID=2502893 RepID=A0A4Q2UF39_9BACT|nr:MULTISPECIES: hypothetical protein [Spirosoma]RYC67893.1 hypothetical protein EQG79_20730 [Spirosoma sordidisoli]